MMTWLVQNAEVLAVVLNLSLVCANLCVKKWWAALYWFAAALIALSVMRMKG
jgi:hypothetical protein